MTPWSSVPDDIEPYFGFIYRITNRVNGMQYIGKKQFWSLTRVAVKGRKNKKHVKKESDWQKYTGSSVRLNADIDKYGMDNFTFEILSLHRSKGSLHYAEVETQVKMDVLRSRFPDGSRMYYNGNISAVKFIPPQD